MNLSSDSSIMSTHIFCTVIDNYGDIGTTWRLALQLQQEYQQNVTLFVDDIKALAQLVPETDIFADTQTLFGVNIQQWKSDFLDIEPSDLVIEAFACTIPSNYRLAMKGRKSIWINLEYFSCEDWVAGCHGLPSYQHDGLKKWFFFPGISTKSGGLLREKSLLQERAVFCADPQQQIEWCQQWQIPLPQDNGVKVLLFGYENTVLPDLLQQLSQQSIPIDVYLPAGKLRASAQPLFSDNHLITGKTLSFGSLTLHLIPFLPQAVFDRLLWLCDLNFVRGEESLVRAIWAGKPFVWHIYPTEDGAHWDKLDAFMMAYSMPSILTQLNREWNQQQLSTNYMQTILTQLTSLKQISLENSQLVSQQDDLCKQLIAFVQSK
jgi:uncharacterized repeat protein (TIGR03837 family)